MFGQAHLHALAAGGREVLAHVVSADRQITVSAVDQDGEPDGLRPAQLGERVQRSPHRAAGEEDVIHEHDRLVVDPRSRDVGVFDGPYRVTTQVVAMHGDVEGAAWHLASLDLGHHLHEATRERNPAGRNTEDNKVLRPSVALKDLVGHTPQGPGDVTGAHHDPRGPGGWISQGAIGR